MQNNLICYIIELKSKIRKNRIIMKFLYNMLFLSIIFVTVLVYTIELIFANNFAKGLIKNEILLDKNSETYEKAINDYDFINNEYIGVLKRIKRVKKDILTIFMYSFIFVFFFSTILKKYTLIASEKHFTLMRLGRFNDNPKEINYLCLIITGVSIVYIFFNFNMTLELNIQNIVMIMLLTLSFFIIILPLIIITFTKMFQLYGVRLIIACYVAYFIKTSSEFLSQSTVDLEVMKKISIDNFSPKIQAVLIKQNLHDKVYKEIKPKSSINAALVGWGSKERIEIYGNHNGFSEEEFESILLHEIGHSAKISLLIKVSVLFTLKLIEAAFLISIYVWISKEYCDFNISRISAFMILYIAYQIFGYKWLMGFHKLASQYAETDADNFAKSYKYGEELGNVLYNICINSKEYIQSTFLYNMLISYHPTVYKRIESLAKK